MAEQSCRTCVHIDRSQGPLLWHRAYRCNAPIPEIPMLADSLLAYTIQRKRMTPDQGKSCPAYERRVKAKKENV